MKLVWTPELRERVAGMIRDGFTGPQIQKACNLTSSAMRGGIDRYELGKIGRYAAPAPSGFADAWVAHSLRELAPMYGVSRVTITRWGRELGLPTKKATIEAARAARVQAKPKKFMVVRERGVPLPMDRVHRDHSPAGSAAEYLRRFGPVVRCDERGAYTPTGNRWRRGSTILTPDEIIARAERQGWRYAA